MALPLPNVVADVGPGGPFVTAMRGMNALQSDIQGNQIQNAQAQFAYPQAQANAFLTQQQAQWLPYQYRMQALPMLMMAAGNDPVKQQQIADMMKQPIAGNTSNFPQPPQNNGLLSLAVNALKNKLFGQDNAKNNGQPQNALNQSPVGSSSVNGLVNSPNNALPSQSMQQSPSVPGGYNTPASQTANNLSGSVGFSGTTPLTAAEAQAKAQEAAVLGQTATQNKEQEEFNTATNISSAGALEAKKALQGWGKAYDESAYKGQYAGSRPASGEGSIPTLPGKTSGPEQLADYFQNKYLQIMSQMQANGGVITDDARSLLSNSKGLTRAIDPDAKKVIYDSTNATLDRMFQQRQFGDSFFRNNPGATRENLTAMLNNYNKYAPSYDYENDTPLPENDAKFKDFTSKKALNSYLENGYYNPYENKKNNNVSSKPTNQSINDYNDSLQGQMPPKYSVWMYNRDGKQVPVHQAKVAEALQSGYKKVD